MNSPANSKSDLSLLSLALIIIIPPLTTMLTFLLVRLIQRRQAPREDSFATSRRSVRRMAERRAEVTEIPLDATGELVLESDEVMNPPIRVETGELEKAETPPVDTAADEPAQPGKADDLTVIEGIGPRISTVLRDAGISTFALLARAKEERLREILKEANVRIANPTAWAEQAKLAAAGKFSELDELQNQLKGKRRAE